MEGALSDASSVLGSGTLAKNCHGASLPSGRQGRYGACFCSPNTKLVEHYECRAKGPDMRSIVRGTEFDASHIFIHVNKLYALQWRSPGLSPCSLLSRRQEWFAKTVTNK
jgi:hypothetical protein